MKKFTVCLLSMLSCLLLLGACASEKNTPSEISKRDTIPFEDGQYYGAAYLGYQQIGDLDYYVQQYLDSDQLPVHYLSSGEYYLVIPRYSGMALSLYRNDMENSQPVLIYEDPDCQLFILQCNVSDIFPDATIRLTYEGETVEFSPFISLKDGSVDIAKRRGSYIKERSRWSCRKTTSRCMTRRNRLRGSRSWMPLRTLWKVKLTAFRKNVIFQCPGQGS